MNGVVDERNRPLLTIHVRKDLKSAALPVTAWVDTAFDGHLVFSRMLIRELGLETLVDTEAILADGSKVVLETFVCYVNWFDRIIPLQVIENEGKYPLLGSGLLAGRVLHIDYVQRSVTLS